MLHTGTFLIYRPDVQLRGGGHAVMTLRIWCVRVCDYLNGFDGSHYIFLKIIESKSVLNIQPKEKRVSFTLR